MAGLADITRIKSEDLRYAIRYSYFFDMHFRFDLVIVFFAGSKPMVVPCPRSFAFFILQSLPSLQKIFQVARDTFIENICSTHIMHPCGEPLNNSAKALLYFDPGKRRSHRSHSS